MKTNCLYDINHTRYRLIKSNPGENVNWLFFPGGPGMDSTYLSTLTELLNVPGNLWLIDMPENGDNIKAPHDETFDFNSWYDCYLPIIDQFEHVILVGHSFGGMLPLFFPELENKLTGFVALNSAPTLWLEAAAEMAKKGKLPSLTEPLQALAENPTPDTFKRALLAHVPYYFTKPYNVAGEKLLTTTPFNYHAVAWYLNEINKNGFNISWIPNKVPTLIIGSSHDAIVPFHLFEQNKKFKKNNIQMCRIENAGHMSWLEKPQEVKALFESFIKNI